MSRHWNVICYYERESLDAPENVNVSKVHTSLLWPSLCRGGAPRSGPAIDRPARRIIRFLFGFVSWFDWTNRDCRMQWYWDNFLNDTRQQDNFLNETRLGPHLPPEVLIVQLVIFGKPAKYQLLVWRLNYYKRLLLKIIFGKMWKLTFSQTFSVLWLGVVVMASPGHWYKVKSAKE